MAIDRVSDLDGCGELSGDTDTESRRRETKKGDSQEETAEMKSEMKRLRYGECSWCCISSCLCSDMCTSLPS